MTTRARWEFRLFGAAAESAAVALGISRQASGQRPVAWQVLLAPEAESAEVRWQDEALCFRRRTALCAGLEQWQDNGRWPLPLARAQVADLLLPALQFTGTADEPIADRAELMQRLVRPGARAMQVRVQRRYSALAGCRGEWCLAEVNGAALHSVALVAEHRATLSAALAQAGLSAEGNCNWLLALRRLAGLAPLPEALCA